VPVAQLMLNHAEDLLDALLTLVLLNKGIKENNSLVVPEAIVVSVAMRRALRSVYHIDLLKREFDSRSKVHDTILELAFFQIFVFIEKWHDKVRDYVHQDEDNEHGEAKEINIELRSSEFYQLHKPVVDGPSDYQPKCNSFKLVRDEELQGHLVEAVIFLKYEYFKETPAQFLHLKDQESHDNENSTFENIVVKSLRIDVQSH
jgi:hypothetical protein